MYITKDGRTNKLTQYECKNIPQVKNIINELTKQILKMKIGERFVQLSKHHLLTA